MTFETLTTAGRRLAALALAGLILAAWPAAAEPEGTFRTASLVPGDLEDPEAVLPNVLGREDVERYRRIFDLQEDGKWREADRLIKELDDRLLMGHVLAQRYLHPTKYRSRYKELKAWLDAYHDHPQAKRLYKLALKRRPKNWKYPHRPSKGYLSGSGHAVERAKSAIPRPPGKARTKAQRREARAILRKLRHFARRGWTKAIKNLVKDKRTQRLLTTVEYDKARAQLAKGYFVDGRDEWALKWSVPAAKRSGTWVPEANWTAGLASWRLGRFDDAARYFEAAAEAPGLGAWMESAAAFWAARSHLVNRSPEKVNRWLTRAADHPRTFYGLLARRLLGLPMPFEWTSPPLDRDAVARLTKVPAAKRALALAQVEESHLAERELRTVVAGLDRESQTAALGLAVRSGMASLAMRLDGLLHTRGDGFDAAAYPLPTWEPAGGFRVDKAVIFALIRQESNFNPKAKSYRGARGLMQLMPATASFVAKDRRYRRSKRRELHEPETNLTLGQKFVEMLLAEPRVGGDLFHLAAAWNGGPGNLNKWLRHTRRHQDDPLLFIECIPLRETRIFIERVLTNLWIYRHRLGQPTPSLDAIAAGESPIYTALDQPTIVMAEVPSGEDRR